jgi:integrase
MGTIRERKTGGFELRIVHKSLPRPYYTTHDTRDQAQAYDARIKAGLDAGTINPGALVAAKAPSSGEWISVVLRAYLNSGQPAPSDIPEVQRLQGQLLLRMDKLTYGWVESWVKDLKAARLAPGTIRKRVECLARAVDWWNRREHELDSMPANPLRLLPRGYSAYADRAVVDVERDRILHPGEHEAIVAAILGHKRADRQRALGGQDAEAFAVLFKLIASTGLRLREAFTLRWSQVRPALRTIHVAKSKTGKARDVPMTPAVADLLSPAGPDSALVFPFWSGDASDLDKCTRRLSARFASAFAYAGCEDLTEHDLRHHATCEWMLMRDKEGRFLFRAEEVMRITGHRTERTFRRYLSLRGSDLAERLW